MLNISLTYPGVDQVNLDLQINECQSKLYFMLKQLFSISFTTSFDEHFFDEPI